MKRPIRSASWHPALCLGFVVAANIVMTSVVATFGLGIAARWCPSSAIHRLCRTATEVLAEEASLGDFFAAHQGIGVEVAVIGGIACLLVGALSGLSLAFWLRVPDMHWVVMPLIWGTIGFATAWAGSTWMKR